MADSEYTPTTAYVRNDYSRDGDGSSDEMAAAEFDRWLAAHDVRVRAEERERCAAVAAIHPDHAANIAYRDALHTILQKVDRGWLQLTKKDIKRELSMVERCVVADAEEAAAIRALPSTPETGETK